MRIGIGYDIHRFDAARPLFIGGVRFEGEPGLAGHSDADVLLHAVIDALLGAAGLGDIGTHFPPRDPEWKDASSVSLLEQTAGMLVVRQLAVDYIDATVIAERPKLASRIPEMRKIIARAAGIQPERVNVKATTNEGLGDIGRGEGIAAMAVALLSEG
ncbi:MAG TPA: 2-C-methyl-D-erythritol 2,4-cyclodiphosphate synthase [Dehalococcoidia bacterium]|jgi:2-C-methyl-D-erythritol 2,4-cyclodiphosphate synthase|nr:2-C-methyl-D-erythritol 2,4-cyclodiphosphate synthase [Dehalococcoidia bacterium]